MPAHQRRHPKPSQTAAVLGLLEREIQRSIAISNDRSVPDWQRSAALACCSARIDVLNDVVTALAGPASTAQASQ